MPMYLFMCRKHTDDQVGWDMTEEDPLSIVQVRYARGEIDTAEYEEFLSCFLKNISFQQVPSLKITSERYANGEISIDQYKEIISHLLNDISNYQQSAPLRVIHLRYAEGELETLEFEEKVKVLMKDIPAYPYSPPLAALFIRFAKGEIDNLRYQEMLTHLAAYCTPTLSAAAAPSPQPEKPQVTPPKTGTPPAGQKPPDPTPPKKTSEAPSSPDPYRLNFGAMQNQSPAEAGSLAPETSRINTAVHTEIGQGRDLQGLGSAHEDISSQPEIFRAERDGTADSGTYHMTGINSAPPVTVLVKPEMDTPKRDPAISFKQNIPEVTKEEIIVDDLKQEELVVGELDIEPVRSEETAEPDNIVPEVSTAPSGNHQMIKALIKQGKYQESINRLDEMLKGTPDDYRSLFLKSIALFNIGKGDEALDILSKAKETCTNKDDETEIDRIYSHIVQKGSNKNGKKKDKEKEPDDAQPVQKEPVVLPSLTSHPERAKNERSVLIQKICEQAQGLIDTGDYNGANTILADIQGLIKDIPAETMQKESIDDLFAAKGFVLYQLKDFCEAKKFFKEATKINPGNETAIHYLNDIRVRDCNKFVRHV